MIWVLAATNVAFVTICIYAIHGWKQQLRQSEELLQLLQAATSLLNHIADTHQQREAAPWS
jgi:hypothetical protein